MQLMKIFVLRRNFAKGQAVWMFELVHGWIIEQTYWAQAQGPKRSGLAGPVSWLMFIV